MMIAESGRSVITSWLSNAEEKSISARNMWIFLNIKEIKEKKPRSEVRGSENLATTYSPTDAVPSALTGLTSLFGMVRGGSPLQ